MTPDTSRTISTNSGVKRSSGERGYGSGTSITAPIVPGRGVITSTRVERKTASSTECVMKSPANCSAEEQPHQLLLQPLAQQLVDGRERLVEEQQRRAGSRAPAPAPRASACRPRAGAGGASSKPVSPTRSSASCVSSRRRAFGHAVQLGVELDVPLEVAPGEQVRLLEHAAGRGLRPRDAAGRLPLEARDDAQHRRLAAAGRPDERHELAAPRGRSRRPGRQACRSARSCRRRATGAPRRPYRRTRRPLPRQVRVFRARCSIERQQADLRVDEPVRHDRRRA